MLASSRTRSSATILNSGPRRLKTQVLERAFPGALAGALARALAGALGAFAGALARVLAGALGALAGALAGALDGPLPQALAGALPGALALKDTGTHGHAAPAAARRRNSKPKRANIVTHV